MSYTINFSKLNVWDFTSESEYVKEHPERKMERQSERDSKLLFLRHRKKI